VNRPYLLLILAAIAASAAGYATTRPASAVQSAPSGASAEQAKAAELLATLEPYIGGEWIMDGQWADGTPLKAREVFEWGVGKKFVRVRTFVTAETGEYQRYEGMYGVKDGKLTGWNFSYDGSSQVGEWKVEGKKLSTTSDMPGGVTLRQSFELVEPDKFHWMVGTEKDGQYTPMFDGFWVRNR
jgi:hypothetical protein